MCLALQKVMSRLRHLNQHLLDCNFNFLLCDAYSALHDIATESRFLSVHLSLEVL